MPTATANGKKFNFPEGTTPEQMGQAIDEYFASQSVQVQEEKPVSSIDGMSTADLVAAGAGKAVVDTGRGLRQIAAESTGALEQINQATGGVLNRIPYIGDINRAATMAGVNTPEYKQQVQSEIDEAKRLDTPLMATRSGTAGNIAGNALMTAPTAFIPGVNTYTGAAVVGGLLGGVTPTETGADRLANIGTGAAFGVVGQAAAKAVGAGLNKAFSRTKAATQYLDDIKAGAAAGQPATQPPGIAAQSSPTMNAGLSVPEKAAATVKERASRSAIRQAIKEGSVESVGWSVDDVGNIVKDPLQRELVKKGLNDKAIVVLRDLTPGDRVAAKEMLDLAEMHVKTAKGASRTRPQMVIGKNAMKRFDVVMKAKQQASNDIGAAVKKDLLNKPANIAPIVDEFYDALDSLGVTVVNGKPNFDESLIVGSNVQPIKNVVSRLKTDYASAAELHRIKQFITNQLDYTPKTGGDAVVVAPLDKQAENALKGLRAKINEQLRSMSGDYAKANDQFRTAIEAVSPFAEAMGRRFDPESDRVFNYVGQELRKTLSNYNSANQLIEAIDGLDSTARQFGGKFDDDLMTQVVINSELERVFGSFAPNSLQGVNEKVADLALSNSGQTVQMAKELYGIVKDKVKWDAPVKDKLELLKQMKELVK